MVVSKAARPVTTKVKRNILNCSCEYSSDEVPGSKSETSGLIDRGGWILASEVLGNTRSPLIWGLSVEPDSDDASKSFNALKARGIYHAEGRKQEQRVTFGAKFLLSILLGKKLKSFNKQIKGLV